MIEVPKGGVFRSDAETPTAILVKNLKIGTQETFEAVLQPSRQP
jgi:hypothetical protein